MKSIRKLQWSIIGLVLCLVAIAGVIAVAAHDDHDATPTPTNHAHDAGSHQHGEPVEITGLELAPQVFLTVSPDPVSGYTLRVQTLNFVFTPQDSGGEHRDGEGHAHLYVNGEKVARIYGEWFHLDSLPTGSNTISVTLNTNTHAPYVVDGLPLEASVTVDVSE